jgi:hypothetical protein
VPMTIYFKLANKDSFFEAALTPSVSTNIELNFVDKSLIM